MKVKHKHNGGTGITNFHKKEMEIYKRAIIESGDKFLCIGEPIDGYKDCLALHDKYPSSRELGFFWRIFEKIEADWYGGIGGGTE